MPDPKFSPSGPRISDHAAGHVFAAVLANAFDHREGAAVAHAKAFAGAARDEKLAGGGAVQNGIAREHIAAPRSGADRQLIDDRAAGQSLADVVVGFAE